ncbi:hypothetical protein [Streptomyces yanii]|uniref:Uncharacterized protein n=1 Tax=Streptomyces yanii TaxID=78510 RepID=A0ABV5R3I1_9ACTN
MKSLHERLHRKARAYAGDDDRPLAAYTGATTTQQAAGETS